MSGSGNGRGAAEPEVHRITDARPAHSDDLDRRINRYLFSMAVRTACVVLVFVVHGPLRWVFAAGAVLLPYVAVVLANASDRRRGAVPPPGVVHRGLPPATPDPSAAPAADDAPPVVLEGQVLPGHTPGPGPGPSGGHPR